MSSDFSLRPATEEDLHKVLEIEKSVHAAPWNDEHFRAELAKPHSQFLIMTDDESDEIVAGYIVFWILMEECHILNVAVGTPHQRMGLARQMVRKAISFAQQGDCKRVFLEVRKSNMPAIQLYQGQGFNIVQVRKNAYSNGEDAYEMVMDLRTTDKVIDF